MTDAGQYDVALVMDWPAPGSGTALRRNTTGFSTIKDRGRIRAVHLHIKLPKNLKQGRDIFMN